MGVPPPERGGTIFGVKALAFTSPFRAAGRAWRPRAR
jgi:hypothetical protein